MDFYLVRHGEAVSDAVDPQRPLAPVGRHEVEKVARRAAAMSVQVAAIFHSGILRARQTAEILAGHLLPGQGVAECSGLLPQDHPMLAKAELEAASKPLMLVGHLPHLGRLAALLVSGDPDREVVNFSPATIVSCSYNGSVWKITWTLTPQSD